MPAVLFVCLGNICRSTMAEGVFGHMVRSRPDAHDWAVDSAGTSAWHIGDPPDRRTMQVLKEHGIAYSHQGRQLDPDDIDRFDHIFAMDDENLANIDRLLGRDHQVEIAKLGDYDPHGPSIIEDPYYGGADGFKQVYQQVDRCCRAFLDQRYPI